MDLQTWQDRRKALRELLPDGIILLLGNNEAPRNYTDNVYPFRQDSSFLYYCGARRPGLALVLAPGGREILFGPQDHPDTAVWEGPVPGLGDLAEAAGLADVRSIDTLAGILEETRKQGLKIHHLPPYRDDNKALLKDLLAPADPAEIVAGSADLVAAVVAMREVKSEPEIAEIEYAIGMSALMYNTAMKIARPGLTEARIAGMIQGVALMEDLPQSFQPIVTVHGEVLHNNHYGNVLKDGHLLLIDSGVESPAGYCSDITRTLPVSGIYSPKQKEIYDIVLSAQQAALELAADGVSNRDLHRAAALATAEGLIGAGLMKGDPGDAVDAGAHALFLPHGLGHMLGLDVHDMEDLGDAVGYEPGDKRSEQFGLNYLRLAKELRSGFVITVEPGCYFIPALIDRWRSENRHADFINYPALASYRDFGGIRLEDDVLITAGGCRVLGVPIPKTTDDIELLMAQGD